MTVHTGEFVNITVNGTDRSEYLVSYERTHNLCDIGHTFTFRFDDNIPEDLDPYDNIVIRENYGGDNEQVFKGYITNAEGLANEGQIEVLGFDKSIRLHDYFIDVQLTSNGESVGYWMSYIANLAGLDIQFDVDVSAPVSVGANLGLMTAVEAMLLLEKFAAVFVRYDSDIDKLRVHRVYTSGNPSTTLSGRIVELDRFRGTENTRNIIKVFGGYKFDPEDSSTTQIIGVASTTVPELVVDKTGVLAFPELDDQTLANSVASRMLSLLAEVDDVHTYTMEGFYPTIDAGDIVKVDFDYSPHSYSGNLLVTRLHVVATELGLFTAFVLNEKCPRLYVQSVQPEELYITDMWSTAKGAGDDTANFGVIYTDDNGETWTEISEGLSGDDKKVRSIGVNLDQEMMLLTADGTPFYRSGLTGTWTQKTALPAPSNDAGDSPAPTGVIPFKVRALPDATSTFYVLAVNDDPKVLRTWIYITTDGGTTWSSKQLYMGTSNYETLPTDLTVDPNTGRVYVALYDASAHPKSVYTMRYSPFSSGYYAGYIEAQYCPEYNATRTETFLGSETYTAANKSYRIFSAPNNRDVAYACLSEVESVFPPTIPGHRVRVWRTTNGGDTWTNIYDASPLTGLSYYWTNDVFDWIFSPASLQGGKNYCSMVLGNIWYFATDGFPPSYNLNGYALVIKDITFGASTTATFLSNNFGSISGYSFWHSSDVGRHAVTYDNLETSNQKTMWVACTYSGSGVNFDVYVMEVDFDSASLATGGPHTLTSSVSLGGGETLRPIPYGLNMRNGDLYILFGEQVRDPALQSQDLSLYRIDIVGTSKITYWSSFTDHEGDTWTSPFFGGHGGIGGEDSSNFPIGWISFGDDNYTEGEFNWTIFVVYSNGNLEKVRLHPSLGDPDGFQIDFSTDYAKETENFYLLCEVKNSRSYSEVDGEFKLCNSIYAGNYWKYAQIYLDDPTLIVECENMALSVNPDFEKFALRELDELI